MLILIIKTLFLIILLFLLLSLRLVLAAVIVVVSVVIAPVVAVFEVVAGAEAVLAIVIVNTIPSFFPQFLLLLGECCCCYVAVVICHSRFGYFLLLWLLLLLQFPTLSNEEWLQRDMAEEIGHRFPIMRSSDCFSKNRRNIYRPNHWTLRHFFILRNRVGHYHRLKARIQ